MMTRLPAEYDDIEQMLPRMSAARQSEIVSLAERLNMPPLDMFCSSLDNSTESFTYFEDYHPIAIGGVVGTPMGGFCWMIASERVEGRKDFSLLKFFMQQSDAQIRKWADVYGDLYADVAVEEARSIRWLEWLGFHRTGKISHLLGRDVCRLERRS